MTFFKTHAPSTLQREARLAVEPPRIHPWETTCPVGFVEPRRGSAGVFSRSMLTCPSIGALMLGRSVSLLGQ
jgi:hypothetical protein